MVFEKDCLVLSFNETRFAAIKIMYHQLGSDFPEVSFQMESALLSRHDRQAILMGLMGLTTAAGLAWNHYENRQNMVIHPFRSFVFIIWFFKKHIKEIVHAQEVTVKKGMIEAGARIQSNLDLITHLNHEMCEFQESIDLQFIKESLEVEVYAKAQTFIDNVQNCLNGNTSRRDSRLTYSTLRFYSE